LNQLQEGAQSRVGAGGGEQRLEAQGYRANISEVSGSESGEIDDLEFLEEVTKIKEEEIRNSEGTDEEHRTGE
jgi:hypothetical protein